MDKCMGVVLSIVDFKESDRIATVFSPGGIVKFYVKRNRSLFSVLTEGEFVYATGRGDMHRFRDGSIFEQHLRLRERLESLEAAGKLVQAVLRSQMQGKAAPHLYQLFCYMLRMIPEADRPEDLVSLFYIKLLKHEGLFQQINRCTLCEMLPQMRFGGERYCRAHAPREALELTEKEEGMLTALAEGRSLKELLGHPLDLSKQVKSLFDQAFS